MKWLALTIVWIGTLAGAFVLGQGRSAPGTTTRIVEVREGAPVRIAPAGLDAEAVRQILREERATPGQVPAATVPEVSTEVYDRALDRVQASLAAGTWTLADRDALRADLTALSREQADDVLSTLFPALNDGRLKLAYDGVPL